MVDRTTADAGGSRSGLLVDLVAEREPHDVAVTLTVDPGRPVALVGPNGVGKTTVLRCVAGLLPITAGRIALGPLVLDEPGAGVFLPPRERPVGLMFQEHRLFDFLDVAGNVAFGLRAAGLPEPQVRQRVAEALERFGLRDLAHRRPATLSGGQSQRVALARTLVTQPRVLLLDEPFASFDAERRVSSRALLAEHMAAFPGPVLMVTHDRADADALGAAVHELTVPVRT